MKIKHSVGKGRRSEGLRLCEDGRGFRVSISFWDDEVE